jgi:hypothetical protein
LPLCPLSRDKFLTQKKFPVRTQRKKQRNIKEGLIKPNFILAWSAHYFAGDAAISLTPVTIIILLVSFYTYKNIPNFE